MKNKSFPSLSIAILFILSLSGCAASTASHSVPPVNISDASVPSGSVDHVVHTNAPRTEQSNEAASKTEGADDDLSDDSESSGEESLTDTALELTETSRELWAAGETEKAIEALDHAYSLILSAPADAEGMSVQQKDDLRFVISRRLMEIYTSRLSAVNGKDKEIPLVINEHVEREIRSFQTLERDFFVESYRRSGRYRDQMVAAFHEAGIPEEITWLPLIESGFKVRALSRARALGLWQFIPSTGHKFGLKRTAWVDERLDPVKATEAAIAYLRELHEVFGDWATVLAAYNCGEGNVFRVIRQQKVNYLDNFWDLYGRLPRETSRYYPRFLAVLAILKEPAKYGFTLDELERPVPHEVVTIERPVQLRNVAEMIGSSYEDLTNLNPELRQAATPNTSYELKIPLGTKERLLAGLDTLPKWSPPKLQYVVHRVRRGETLSTIAIRYRSSIQRIMETNGLRNGRTLRAGQRLRIPLRDT